MPHGSRNVCETPRARRAHQAHRRSCTRWLRCWQQQHITELPREVHKKGDHTGQLPTPRRHRAAAGGPRHGPGFSEAGMPAVADPGSLRGARTTVAFGWEPLTGLVSLAALAPASGPNGQNPAFTGYPATRRANAPSASANWKCWHSSRTDAAVHRDRRTATPRYGKRCCTFSQPPGWFFCRTDAAPGPHGKPRRTRLCKGGGSAR